jgi:hypothetical protein
VPASSISTHTLGDANAPRLGLNQPATHVRRSMSALASRPEPRPEAEIFADLAALCASPGYAEAIATICARDNMVQLGAEGMVGDVLSPMFSQDRLIRTEVATLVGLLAQQPIDAAGAPLETVAKYVARTEALLLELHDALGQPWRVSLRALLDGTSTADPFSSGDAMREPVFYSGESAFSFQYRDFAASRYRADDAWLLANRGFDIATARDVVEAIGRLQVRKVMAAMEARERHGEATTAFLPAFAFTAQEVAQVMGVTEARVARILEAFALDAHDRNPRFQKLQDFNATNATPLLRLGNGRFLLFHIYMLDEALYESPAFWISADKAYAETAKKHRGDYPEQFTLERLAGVFGKAAVYSNVLLPAGRKARHGEIDVLVVFGDHAIVVQNKSKRLTIASRQGDDTKLREDFKQAIQDACDQARICAEALLKPECVLTDKAGQPIRLARPIRRVFPVCLVADHYPALAAQVRQFLRWTPTSNVDAPLVTDLFALDAMAEILGSPLRLLSYLDLRARFADRVIFSHEMTLLGYHLKQNLWIDDDVDQIMLEDGLSADLEAAMVVRREGLPGPRTPPGILPATPDAPIAHLVEQFERNPDAVELGLRLLHLSGRSMQTLTDGIGMVVAASRRDGARHDFGMGFGDAGLTVHSNPAPIDEARDFLRAHCTLKKHQQKADTWYGLLVDPVSGDICEALRLHYRWAPDPTLDEVVKDLRPRPMPAQGLRGIHFAKIKRNAPCPCGSGRKWKVCCRL